MAIMFGDGRPEDKPSQAVIDTMKASGLPLEPNRQDMGTPGTA